MDELWPGYQVVLHMVVFELGWGSGVVLLLPYAIDGTTPGSGIQHLLMHSQFLRSNPLPC